MARKDYMVLYLFFRRQSHCNIVPALPFSITFPLLNSLRIPLYREKSSRELKVKLESPLSCVPRRHVAEGLKSPSARKANVQNQDSREGKAAERGPGLTITGMGGG
jgi:hypothetical protein